MNLSKQVKMSIPDISIIAAVSSNGIIGVNGKIPWNIPEDMRYFKQMTSQSTVIMGRHTFESIGGALPNRNNIVVTSEDRMTIQKKYREQRLKGVFFLDNFDKAVVTGAMLGKEIFLIGGYQVYKDGFKYANKLYLTEVYSDIEVTPGDEITMFPGYNVHNWTCISSRLGNDHSEYKYKFQVFTRSKRYKTIVFK